MADDSAAAATRVEQLAEPAMLNGAGSAVGEPAAAAPATPAHNPMSIPHEMSDEAVAMDGLVGGESMSAGAAAVPSLDDEIWQSNPHFGGVPKKPTKGTLLAEDSAVSVRAGVFAMRGMRPTMEDHHVMEAFDSLDPDPASAVACTGAADGAADGVSSLASSKPRMAFYGVFDGHGGHRASRYVSENLRPAIMSSAHFAEANVRDALLEGFAAVETNWMQKAYAENMEDGTTAVVALLLDRTLWIANVGDSEAVLSRDGVPTVLSIAHNAKSNKTEEVRVTKAGGKVRRARLLHPVWAVLNIGVTRSIGASAMKAGPNTDGRPSGLIAVPDVNAIPLCREDEFLILACDGLWDVLTYLEAADFVRHQLTVHNGNAEAVARALVNRAFEKGSLDNITALVVVFDIE